MPGFSWNCRPSGDLLKVDRWDEKTQTAAAVRKAINDYLFEKLPYPEYEEPDIAEQTERVYAYLVGRYAA